MTTSAHYEVIHLIGGCAVALIGQYHYSPSSGKCRYTIAHEWHVEKWIAAFPMSVETARREARRLNETKDQA